MIILKLVILTILVLPSCCIPVSSFYSFGEEAGDQRLAWSDDGASPPVQLTEQFPFYDQNQKSIHVSNNGLLSFITPVTTFSTRAFPIPSPPNGPNKNVIIAPFWGDVDTSGDGLGNVWYRQTKRESLLNAVKADIAQYAFLYPDIDIIPFDPTLAFIATWENVGYYRQQVEKRNTFQCVLATDGLTSFAIFLYDKIEWTTGDGSNGLEGLGGTPAQVGFNAGDGIRSYALPLSQTEEVAEIDHLPGNTGEPGLWIFRVDKETINDGQCNDEASITLLPNKGSYWGGSSVSIVGPCFQNTKYLKCTFKAENWSDTVNGTILNERKAICIVPPLTTVGRLQLQVSMTDNIDQQLLKSATFYSLPADSSAKVEFSESTLLFYGGSELNLKWNPQDVFPYTPPHSYTVDISLFALTRNTTTKATSFVRLASVVEDIPNSGAATMQVPLLQSVEKKLPIAFQITVNRNSLPDGLQSSPGIWTTVGFYYDAVPSRTDCINWVEKITERDEERRAIERQPHCPCTLSHAAIPGSGVIWDQSSASTQKFFNQEAYKCGFLLNTGKDGDSTSRQCCYDSKGYLILHPPSGGHSNLIHPEKFHENGLNFLLEHFEKDTIPFLDCCKSRDTLCAEYYKFRPSSTQECAVLQHTPGAVFGDPHFSTFDSNKFTFNGRGEYILMQTDDKLHQIQGRFTEIAHTLQRSVTATILSVIVVQSGDADITQFELSRRGLDVSVNGELLPFDEAAARVVLNKAVLYKEAKHTVSVWYDSELKVTVNTMDGYISIALVSIPAKYRNRTMGLLGNFNGDQLDDLIPRDSSVSIPTTSSLRDIHEVFGLSWIIWEPTESLFTYRSHESLDSFFHPDFSAEYSPSFSNPVLERQGVELCAQDEFCLFDVATTGRLDLGNITKIINKKLREVQELTKPITCDPPCDHGVCAANNSCQCQHGFQGERCDTAVLAQNCSRDICNNRGICKEYGGDTVCICSTNSMGFNCEKTIFKVECTTDVSDGMLTVSCSGTQSITVSSCQLDDKQSHQCTFPWQADLTSCNISAGRHFVRISSQSSSNQTAEVRVPFEVKPIGLNCNGEANSNKIVVNGCSTNNLIKALECSVNGARKSECELPLSKDLTREPAGTYVVNVTVMDVYRFSDNYIIQYTKPLLRAELVNSSPRVSGSTAVADFTVNRPRGTFTASCYLTRQPKQNCTQGNVRFEGLSPSTYTLRIVTKSSDGERHVLRRRLYVGESDETCLVHLINSGIEVTDHQVAVHFLGSLAVDYCLCRLDGSNYERCRSPHRLADLSSGPHRIQVVPVCRNTRKRHRISASFLV